MALHRLGCDLYTGQQVDLLAALVEAGFRPHQRHHAAYAGRTLRAFHVQFAIAGALALLAMGADTVSAFQLHRPQGGEQALGALIVIPRLSAAGASGPWGGVSRLGQQRRQYSGPGPMQPGASGHFDGLQVQAGALPLGRKHYLEKRLDFPCDFLMNSRSRFFSASVQPAASGSAGRKRQICSLTAVNSAVRSCKRWNSVTSSAALRNAAGVAKDSARLLPLTLRSRRNCGWAAPSGRAQWQLGLPQRRGTADMVPGRKSPRVRNCRNSLFRAASSSAREWGTRHPPFSVYIYTENPDNPGLYRKTSISMSRTRGAGIH